jgi:hypothetical protein
MPSGSGERFESGGNLYSTGSKHAVRVDTISRAIKEKLIYARKLSKQTTISQKASSHSMI